MKKLNTRLFQGKIFMWLYHGNHPAKPLSDRSPHLLLIARIRACLSGYSRNCFPRRTTDDTTDALPHLRLPFSVSVYYKPSRPSAALRREARMLPFSLFASAFTSSSSPFANLLFS